MELFLDTEFTGLQQQSSLISIALVLDETHFFYAEFNDYDLSLISAWHQENVIKNLIFLDENHFVESLGNKTYMKGTTDQVREVLTDWFKKLPKVEIWADVLAYDWVLFCNIFGNAFQLPPNIFYIPFDIATLLKIKGINPDIPRLEYAFEDKQHLECTMKKYGISQVNQHNALVDAIMHKTVYNKTFSI